MKAAVLGITEIDSEHEKLHALVTDLDQACSAAVPDDAHIRGVLAHLLDQTKQHFESEEALMRAWDYNFLTKHADEHRDLVRALESIIKMHDRGEMPAERTMVKFVWDWFLDHVDTADRDFAEHLQRHRYP